MAERIVRPGLYDPGPGQDACGVAFLADLHGRRDHRMVSLALEALRRMDHRGARTEPDVGDGAGIMLQIPDAFYRRVTGAALPPPGGYATGLLFLPTDPDAAERALRVFDRHVAAEGAQVLAWRKVPTDDTGLGARARDSQPRIRQVFLAARDGRTGMDLERLVWGLRRLVERETRERGIHAYFSSLSTRTVVYKGMLTPAQLATYYPDLSEPDVISALAVVHSRFSTDTLPSWSRAHPYRLIAHNGSFTTIRGNVNWMTAREAALASPLLPEDLRRLLPVCNPEGSDTASFDEVLELLNLAGRSLPHALLMMMPPAWENDPDLDPDVRAFHQFHACLMEPWDGPANVVFSDGTLVGAIVDRKGLRSARWWRTRDGMVVLASETGVVDADPADVVARGRLEPGRMLVVDTAAGRVLTDREIRKELATAHPYREWVADGLVELSAVPPRPREKHREEPLRRRQAVFGWTEEELKLVVAPMARTGAEPVGSMGTDTPVSPLSQRPRLLYDYFHQLFAQVTNPPLDAIREKLTTSMTSLVGPEGNLLAPGPDSCRQVVLPRPVIDTDELARLLGAGGDRPEFTAMRVAGLYPVREGAKGLRARLVEICRQVSEAIEDGVRVLVLSDRGVTADLAPIPSLLLVAAVHQHLLAEQTRTRVALVVESGDCREVHHLACLVGYGAAAVNPYLAQEAVEELAASGALPGTDAATAVRNYYRALSAGLLKVMSKMGISTVASYRGAQIFEAVGLDDLFLRRYFAGTPGSIGGVGLEEIHAEIAARHARAWPANPAEAAHQELEAGGEYRWRRDGEVHLFNPETVFLLQHATRAKRYDIFRRYTEAVDALAARTGSLRGLLRLRTGVLPPVPVDEVEPASEIVKRFGTGAVSYGSISAEAHETLAVAMNRIGGRSNSGEGGEDRDRLYDPLRRSAVKQVASGRFGVTTEYLVNATDLQIKMAQGAKPGEGGQLPGTKVWPWIARTRHATPGVELISPPPHHDIYSIEDLAQLVYDLKCVNPSARVHVKLVSSAGVGTVATGVAKLKADVILISGHDGGTGAAPLGSIKHAGTPWEIGLAETQQALLANGLRDRVTLQVDGQLRTGRDVVVAALLGAEEYGFATVPLIVAGCVMMRVCHLDTCPVGIATQDPVLRRRYTGTAELVEQFFWFLAEQVRELLASLGLRSVDEAVGRVDLLEPVPAEHWKAHRLDLSPLLHAPPLPEGTARRRTRGQEHHLDRALDRELIAAAQAALVDRTPVRLERTVRNADRSVGAMLAGEITRRHGGDGLPEGTVDVTFTGSAGQSFGAFAVPGMTLRLVGEANDYVGKGLSGGRLILRPDPRSPVAAEDQVIAGNALLYGATAGTLFCRGRVGERFAVRNSGAVAVVEGIGDHGCEYMTGGTVVVIGPTGRNFAAGMSGGVAYVWRLDDRSRVNPEQLERDQLELSPLTPEQREEVRRLLARHAEETGSAVAARLLADWPAAAAEFTAVVPRMWRRIREAMRAAEADGRDVDAAVMELVTGDRRTTAPVPNPLPPHQDREVTRA